MTKTPLYVHILLDRSGSMESCRDTTIDAFNEYVMGLRRSDKVDARLSLTTFDSESIDLIAHDVSAASFLELSRANYVPRASTPLLDAIGHAVAETDKVMLRKDEGVSLVILTDGLENASKEYKKPDIRALLEGRQKDKGWLITFLGADVDAFAEANAIGVHASSYVALKKGKLRQAMEATRGAQEIYAESRDNRREQFAAATREDLAKE
ncbi:MAG: vWA domain-containing protein [Pseudomonadota bacterium]